MVGGVGAAIVELGGVDTRVVPDDLIAAALLADDPGARSTTWVARGFRALADAIGADRHALAAQAQAVHKGRIPLERIAAPTLVLVGDADPLGARPEVLAEALPERRVQIVPGDHLTAVAAPGFAPAVVAFLAG